jgi:hypothetical protein
MSVLNRLGGLLLGVLLLALGLLVVVEAVALSTWHRSWPVEPLLSWRDNMMATPWSDWRVWFTGLVVLVVGLLILLAQLRRVRPKRLSTAENGGEIDWILDRRSVEHRAASAAESIRGVTSAKAVTRGSANHWRLNVTAKARGDVVDRADVEEAVHAQLRDLGVPVQVPVRVTVRRT